MTAVLVIVLGIALVSTYTALTRAALLNAATRLERATRRLATVAATSLETSRSRYLAVANDSAIRRALAAAGSGAAPPAAAVAALGRLSLPSDSGMPVELWSADGRRVAFTGNDIRGTLRSPSGRPELPAPVSAPIIPTGRVADSLRLTPLYVEDGRVHFWLLAPVLDSGRGAIAWIAHQRRIARNPQTEQTLRELSGDSISTYYHNVDGTVWTTVSGVPLSEALHDPAARAPAREGVLFHEERIPGTPLVIAMDVPRTAVLSRPWETLRSLLLMSILLVVGGAAAAWILGRRVARPLGELTRAAAAIAAGDFSARVPEHGDNEVRRLAASFNDMAEEVSGSHSALARQTREARAANAAKSEFLTMMSHELRTPLNAIAGYVELFLMGLRGPVTDAQRRDLERIRASQQHLLGLISGVLDLSRIESGRVVYDLEPVALDPFLAGLDALVEPQVIAKDIRMEYEPCPPGLAAIADSEKLRQVMLNLLSNAIRFTPAKGTITLSCVPGRDRVSIVVQDTGPGIPEDRHEKIFEPFVQLDRSLTRTLAGLGLGLAISRDLARGMHGDITVESRPGEGARFLVTLPMGVVDPNERFRRSDESTATAPA